MNASDKTGFGPGVNDKAECTADEYQSMYEQLIDGLYEGYSEYDLKGNLIRFNQAIIEMGGRDGDELSNLSYKTFHDPETMERITRIYKEVYRTGIPQKWVVNDIIHKDGHKVTLEGFVSLIIEDGKPVGFRGIWRDITRRIKREQVLAHQRRRLETIFENVKEAIITVNSDGQVINANRAVETICGLTRNAIISRPIHQLCTLCGQACLAMLQETLIKWAEVRENQIACCRKDREQQVVVVNSSPLKGSDGRSMGAVLVIRDITDRLGLEKALRQRYQFQNIIGKSRKMREIYDLLENLADLETTVLITGESGTGKELVAKALHFAGQRSHGPFIRVNCSALAESLLESELFGHAKGAFTGALRERQGRFELADGGTLFLDEIGDISPLIQLKLLRVLQEKEFERVGESTPRKVDVRLIAATNKDLAEKVKKGEFRQDLYYRLKVMEITLPALRERREDLPLLVDHFLKRYARHMKKKIHGVSAKTMHLFLNYPWPGNVRELEHALEHAFVLCKGRTIELEHLPDELWNSAGGTRGSSGSSPAKENLTSREVRRALVKSDWNKSKAARLLGVDRGTILRKVRLYDLKKE